MEIIYKDYSQEIITQQQATIIGRCKKIFLENETIKKIEEYDNFILEYIDYYKNIDEDEQQIVQELTPSVNIGIQIINPKEPLGNYFFEISNSYREGVFSSKTKILYDEFDNIICIQSFDINTDLPILKRTDKYFYGLNPTEKKEEIFTAEYNDDGSLFIIHFPDIDPLGKSKYYDATDFSELEARFPSNPDLSYYLNATFEP